MAADAEAELRILIKDFARIAAGGPLLEVSGDKRLVLQRPRHQSAHRRLGGGPGIGAELMANVGCELTERVAHGNLLLDMVAGRATLHQKS